jgi:RNA-directed DNA polymerase
MAHGGRLVSVGSEHRAQLGHRDREENPKRRETGDGKSECLDGTDESGELAQRTPRREARHQIMEPLKGKNTEMSSSDQVSTKQQRIAELARQMPEAPLWSLSRFIDVDWLKEAHRRTRKGGAPGVDGITADEYGARLDENLGSLLDRAKSGAYQAPPVRRAHIPKNERETRPIGIPTFEDKVLQRAVVMALEPIYEQEFHECSYGFRPGRGVHGALAAFWDQAMKMAGGWVLEVDIESFFDTIDHKRLQDMLRQRVADGVLLRLIGKWLNAGVLDEEGLRFSDEGTPQGGVISPLLANIYLHEVIDEWFAREVKPRLSGDAFLIRYADDFVICFAHEVDAHRVMRVLPRRFERYGLALHDEKTRLVPFGSPNRTQLRVPTSTFDFLGFTHYWGSTKNRLWAIKRKTASSRFSRSIRRIAEWCRWHRHEPLHVQHRSLVRKLKGHYAFYGITGNADALQRFWYATIGVWYRWLSRRSRRRMSWQRFIQVTARYPLPCGVAIHSVLRRPANL